jgi:hypothetical protein
LSGSFVAVDEPLEDRAVRIGGFLMLSKTKVASMVEEADENTLGPRISQSAV